MQQLALVAEKLTVLFGQHRVLKDITLTIGMGEFVGIIGPNGAGKSTLLRSLGGLERLASGQVFIQGEPLAGMSAKKAARQIAFMQQEVNVGFGFTALELVLAGRYPHLQWWQNESDEDRRIAKHYMAFTGVAALAERPVNQVSGGERQRIMLAKVLAQETPIVFLDEPTASLDLTYQEEIFRYCRIMCEKQNKTTLIIAHDIRLAAKFCSRLVLLAGGNIIADGAPETVITEGNLAKAYGLHAAVFTNRVTGNLDIHTYEAAGTVTVRQWVHIIGGGGSAGELIRRLHERNFRLSAGVFQQGDTDADVAAAFGVDTLLGPPFMPISEQQGTQNRQKIGEADWTVLTNLCYGEQNLDNLAAAFSAKKLIVIEDTPIEQRDFTGGKAFKLYKELCARPQVTVLSSDKFYKK